VHEPAEMPSDVDPRPRCARARPGDRPWLDQRLAAATQPWSHRRRAGDQI